MARAIKKAAAIALAAGLTFSSVAGTSALTLAQAQPIGAQIAAPHHEIGTKGGKLTIHKYKNPNKLANSTGGNEATDDQLAQAGDPMEGAIFTATKINLDLTKNEDFEKAAKLTPQEAAKILEKQPSKSHTGSTDSNGVVEFELELGAYLIREVPTEDQFKEGLVPAAPFIAYMPMTNPGDTEWNRDVHVYPKNTELRTVKTVDDADKHPGLADEDGKLTYTISSTVPQLPENRKLTKFNIVDFFNVAELEDLEVAKVTKNGNLIENEESEYYHVDHIDTTETPDRPDANKAIVVEFTDKGLDDLRPEDTISVILTGTVSKIGDKGLKDGEVANYARTEGATVVTAKDEETGKDEPLPLFDRNGKNVPLFDNEGRPLPLFDKNGNPLTGFDKEGKLLPGFGPTAFTTPPVEVKSYFGKVLIKKYEKSDEGAETPIEGTAKFELYKVEGDDCTKRNGAQEIEKNLEVTGGYAEINGLHVTDVENYNKKINDTYCLVETEAPEGYLLDKTPRDFKLTKENVTKERKDVKVNEITYTLIGNVVEVENRKQPALTLPMTGGTGVALLILAGLLIVGGGVYAARRNSL